MNITQYSVSVLEPNVVQKSQTHQQAAAFHTAKAEPLTVTITTVLLQVKF